MQKSIRHSLLWTSFATVSQAILQLLVFIILSRVLKITDFGVYSSLLLIVNFANLSSQFGVSAALVQFARINSLTIKSANLISVGTGLLFSIIIFLCSSQISGFININDVNAVRCIALYLPLKSMLTVYESLLQREMKFRRLMINQIAGLVFGYSLFAILFAVQGYGYYALMTGIFSQVVISLVLALFQSTKYFSLGYNNYQFKKLLRFGFGSTLGNLFNYFADEGDNFVVNKKLGIVSLGLYSRAFQLYAISSRLFGIVYEKVFFPHLSRFQQDKKILKTKLEKNLNYSNFILAIVSSFLLVNSEYIVLTTLGEKWSDIVDVFAILTIGLNFRFGTKILKVYLKSIGAVYVGAVTSFIFAILVFTTCLYVSNFGLIGIASAVVVSAAINYCILLFYMRRNLEIPFNQLFMNGVKYLVLYLLNCCILASIKHYLPVANEHLSFAVICISQATVLACLPYVLPTRHFPALNYISLIALKRLRLNLFK